MNEEQILEKLNEIFCNVFDDDDLILTRDTSPEQIEDWDSLEHITVIMLIEKQLHAKFTMEEAANLFNVGMLVDGIMEKLNHEV